MDQNETTAPRYPADRSSNISTATRVVIAVAGLVVLAVVVLIWRSDKRDALHRVPDGRQAVR